MSYPASFMDELHSRLSLAEEVGKRITLTRKGNQYWGLCPFHKEKTGSFAVNDDRGFYHCFGCGAHGDIISFVMQADGLSFPEAVEKLAGIAGLEIPRSTPAEREREARKASLYEVLNLACNFYQEQLYAPAGKEALAYIRGRGLSDTLIAEFRLGFSGGGKSLKSTLIAKGITSEQLLQAGLFAESKNNGSLPYEYFKNRIMFPITDKGGRVIAFGGRVMDDSEPKYLNSPETELFHKSDVLYSFAKASVSAREKNQIILCEGYMDVISLNIFGIDNAVAPLGTALTERQIEGLWKLADEPIICFDGDTAGLNAASRAAQRVLPVLKEGKSLKFIFLPDKMDPDELLKSKGSTFFLDMLKYAEPLSDFVWNNLIKGKKLDTPERKAMLEKDIKTTLDKITNPTVQNYYRQDFKNKLWEITGNGKTNRIKTLKKSPADRVNLAAYNGKDCENKIIICYLLLYPDIMAKWLEKLSFLTFSDSGLQKLFDDISTAIMENPEISREALADMFNGNKLAPVKNEMEMLKKKTILPDDFDKEMQERLTMAELKEIEAGLAEITQELALSLDNPSDELWTRYNSLLQVKQKLQEELLS